MHQERDITAVILTRLPFDASSDRRRKEPVRVFSGPFGRRVRIVAHQVPQELSVIGIVIRPGNFQLKRAARKRILKVRRAVRPALEDAGLPGSGAQPRCEGISNAALVLLLNLIRVVLFGLFRV